MFLPEYVQSVIEWTNSRRYWEAQARVDGKSCRNDYKDLVNIDKYLLLNIKKLLA